MRFLFAFTLALILSGSAFAIPPQAPAMEAEASAACVRVDLGNAGGSGTCIYSEDGYSLILTAGHVAEHLEHGHVTHEGKTYAAHRYVNGTDSRNDLGLFWVAAELPVVAVAESEPAAGTVVTVYGRTTKYATGRVTGVFPTTSAPWTTANYPSDSGDSGAGVFDASGRLVGVHLGRFGIVGQPAQVAPVTAVRVFVREVAGPRFPRLRTLFAPRAKATVTTVGPPAAAPAPKAKPVCECGETCPKGGCAVCDCPPAVKAKAAVPVAPPPVTFTLPSSAGGCPGGVCPTVTSRPRGFIFRR